MKHDRTSHEIRSRAVKQDFKHDSKVRLVWHQLRFMKEQRAKNRGKELIFGLPKAELRLGDGNLLIDISIYQRVHHHLTWRS